MSHHQLHPQPIAPRVAATQTAQENLSRLQAALATARADAAGIEAQIAAGAGISDPTLFGQRRNLADLTAWLGIQEEQAQKALYDARGAERRAREDIASLQSRLNSLRMQHAETGVRITRSVRAGATEEAAHLHSEQLTAERLINDLSTRLRHLEG